MKKTYLAFNLKIFAGLGCFAFLFFMGLSGCISGGNKGPSIETFTKEFSFKSDFQISPDGKMLAWITKEKDEIDTISFKQAGAEDDDITSINTHSWCNILWFRWLQDSKHIIYTLYAGKHRPIHIYSSDIENPSAVPVDLTPDAKHFARFIGNSPWYENAMIFSQDNSCANSNDIYTLDLISGKTQKMDHTVCDPVVTWVVDTKGEVKGRVRVTREKKLLLEYYDQNDPAWIPLSTWDIRSEVEILGMTSDGKNFWLISNQGRDKKALVRFNIKTKKETVIYADDRVDVEGVYISRVSGKPLFIYIHPDYPEIIALESDFRKDLEHLKSDCPRGISIISMDTSETLWTVKAFDQNTENHYLYNRKIGEKTILYTGSCFSSNNEVVQTEPVMFKSRDGLDLHGYLTVSKSEKKGDDTLAVEKRKTRPLVLLVHGGPWVRDYWKQNLLSQLLVSRGYAVLQVNYRGSSGYGKKYMEAARFEFGKNMHHDLEDAVFWAIKQKITDPDHVAIVGGSYGGYAAMSGVAFTPDLFSCAVSINGVSDWSQLVSSREKSSSLFRNRGYAIWKYYLGDMTDESDRKNAQNVSPYYHVDQIKKPLLIIYGDEDEVVHADQSIKMIKRLKRKGKKVKYLRFDNEGHSISWDHNSMEMYKHIVQFLSKYLDN